MCLPFLKLPFIQKSKLNSRTAKYPTAEVELAGQCHGNSVHIIMKLLVILSGIGGFCHMNNGSMLNGVGNK